MPDEAPPVAAPGPVSHLRPADPADLVQALAFALRYQGRRRVDTAGETMARITAEHLIEHLAQLGFVVMQKPARPDAPDEHYGSGFKSA